jgi:hypothetical protein
MLSRSNALLALALLAAGCGESASPAPPATPSAAPASKPPSAPAAAPRPPAGAGSSMIATMHARFDELWEAKPGAGEVHLRVLLKADGAPVAGEARMQSDFQLRAVGSASTTLQAFNPNAKGRFVYEDLKAGTYKIEIVSLKGVYETWSRDGVALEAGASPLLEVELKKK